MNRRTAVLSLFAALAQTAKSDEPDQNWKTQGLVNGRYWNEMLPRERTHYVLGAVNCVAEVRKFAFATFMPATAESKRFDRGIEFALATDHYSLDEVVDKITAIYGEQGNIILPIIDVYSFAVMALNGTDPDDLTK